MVAQARSVVIIEDDGDLRGLVAAVLSQAGYRVGATGDPRCGVDLVRREQPDLVLCDIAMPQMDGFAVVQALQSDATTRRFPVVFLTARREFTDRVRAFRFGVVDYITKPVTSETLLSRVDSILGGLDGRPVILKGEAPILLEEVGRDRPARQAQIGGDDPPRPADDLRLPDFSEISRPLREIVIADDNEPFRSMLAGVFERCGFQVREATDGLEAVRRVLEKPPSLLLVDVRMPVLDGFEVCRRLRNYALTRHLPIVFLSGFDEFEDRAAGLEAGANEFLSKQTSLREMLLRVQLQLQRYNRPANWAGETALHGRIGFLGAPGVLRVCALTSLTGTLTATKRGQSISMGFDAGRLLSADSTDAHGQEAVFEFVAWDHGTFVFAGGPPHAGTPVHEPLNALVLEGCRRIDGRNRERAGLAAPGASGS
jgi:DNA-binding response OmpR family regulator